MEISNNCDINEEEIDEVDPLSTKLFTNFNSIEERFNNFNILK